MLIRAGRRLDGEAVDIRVATSIVAVAARIDPLPGEQVIDAGGGLVIPGLHDHHVHIRAAAAATGSLQVGPPQVRDRAGLTRILGSAEVDNDGWIRAVGYHDSVAGHLDRALLDAVSPPAPVRVQHRSGVLWTLNSAALAAIGRQDHSDGRLLSADPGWTDALPRRDGGLPELGRRLAAYGVTGITDATPNLEASDAQRLSAALPQRVHRLSPGKRILHDDGLDLDELTEWVRITHDRGTAVALHCVTAGQLVVTLAALRAAGCHPQDRIEHAAIVPDDCIGDLADLGVTVVTQPNFVAERGEQYLADVPDEEQDQLWRLASLRRAGVRVALSTDMPFGDGDPWAAMRAAVHRVTAGGEVLGPDECVSPRSALTMFAGSADDPAAPRSVEPGQPGDLCLLAVPPDVAIAGLDAGSVAMTLINGGVVYQAHWQGRVRLVR
jgi:predicted amidohydrolase YtcJ